MEHEQQPEPGHPQHTQHQSVEQVHPQTDAEQAAHLGKERQEQQPDPRPAASPSSLPKGL